MLNDLIKGKLIIFAAPSGAGKSSLIKKIVESSDGKIELSVSVTTRSPREGEEHGRDYFFVTDEEFNALKIDNAFIEHATVHEYQYGTLKTFIDEKTNSGKDIILDIDVQGYEQIKKSFVDTISIFILPPSLEELEQRLKDRGLDSENVIKKRLVNAKSELMYAENFDHILVNDNFEKTIEYLKLIIFDEKKSYDSRKSNNILKDLLDK